MSWIRKVLGLCSHKWEIDMKVTLTNEKKEGVGMLYVLRCSECGEIKEKRVN